MIERKMITSNILSELSIIYPMWFKFLSKPSCDVHNILNSFGL